MKIVLIYSGGIDSTVLLHHAVKMHGRENVEAVTFNYGSKHNSREIECAIWNTKHLKVKHNIIGMDFIRKFFKSTLLEDGGDIPYGHYEEESMKQTVVPLRNGIMIMVAAGLAESNNADEVWIGAHAGDHFCYPDTRPEFNKALGEAVEYGTESKVSLQVPFNTITKTDIVKMGEELKVDWNHTYSCYKGQSVHCGKCGTCTERIESFKKAGVEDPLMRRDKNGNDRMQTRPKK